MNAMLHRHRSRGSSIWKSICAVLVCCVLPLGHCQEWSGFVNSLGARFNYTCPDDQVITGLASDFSSSIFDRQWEFQCDTGGGLANVTSTCTLQSSINTLRGLIDFDCPSDGYVSGFVSQFDASQTDRLWQPYCCTRPFSSLINCQTLVGSWENPLRGNLNYTAPTDNHVVTGIQSFYFNRDRRWRFTSCEVEVNCGDPGIVENAVRVGSSFLYGDYVTYTCNDGYYQSSGAVGGVRMCLETGLWSDTQPECTSCTDIPDCEAILCTNSTDHFCSRCRSNNGTGLGEFAFANLITECEPRCSWLSTFCFPGVCPSGLSSCNCSMGFEGEDCLNITESPLLLSCSLTLHGSDGRDLMASCLLTNTTTEPIFTNIVPSELEADWTVSYTGPATPPQPAYVDSYEVGVAVSEIRAFDYRAANPSQFITSSTHGCIGPAPSPDSPVPDVVACSTGATPTNLTAHTFLHGDLFEVQSFASAGGYLDILNLDTSSVFRHYYTGIPTFGLSSFIIDILAPTHCSLVAPSNGCLQGQSILDLGGEIVEDNSITASWGGWIDVPSGVTHYEIRVYPLQLSGDVLSEVAVSINTTTYDHQNSRVTYEDTNTLPFEGPYSFILMSFDLAGNVRLSRRLLLYDNTSIIEVDQTAPLQFISAVPESGYQWQNSTSDPLIVRGIGHFYNTFLRYTNYLAPIANSSIGDIDPEFDQPSESGRYPRSGTVNAQGIIQVLYDVIVDSEGGRSLLSLTQPTNFPYETTDVGIEAVEIVDTELNDGDSVTVWFQVIDFRFQTSVDSTVVHIDSSPPALTDLWLEWNGDIGLNLHGTDSLLDLTIQFQTYDIHSGIYAVEWSIRTRHGDVGYGMLPVQNVNESICFAPQCFCDSLLHCSQSQYSFSPLQSNFLSSSEALHDTDYSISVTVTNFARLSTTLEHAFTVDTTPPTPGVVFDGFQFPDIDYQDHVTLNAWWTGFFDRETDIPFYQYIFANSCVAADTFSYPLNETSGVSQTHLTSASLEVAGEGIYYITVVAYNNALQPSQPVCSDGVTVDLTPPTFVGVSIPGARVKPGLVVDSGGQYWLVEEDRERVMIDSYSGWCANSSVLVEDLSAFPIKRFSDGSVAMVTSELCQNYSPFISSQPIYLRGDHALNVSWYASDNVGFQEFYVGIVARQNYTGAMSDIEYSPTAGQMHYSIYDPELIANGNTFYLSLKSADVAVHEVQLDIGPIIVDVSSPVVNGSLAVVQASGHVIVIWQEGTFYDEEDMEPLQLEYAIGRSQLSEDIQYFQSVPSPDSVHCSTPYCFTIDLATLGTSIISGHDYIITVRAINSAGLTSYSTTDPPFTYTYGLPSVGVVFDIDSSLSPDLIGGINYSHLDVDVLLDPSELGARWAGFLHPDLNVTFSISLGTQPFSQDIVAMTTVGDNTSYVFDGAYLNHSMTYYITVAAESSVGQVNATSDGVLVLRGLGDYLRYATVYDGLFEIDIDYQASLSSASARWVFPTSIHSYISHYMLALMRIADSTNFTLEQVSDFQNVGLQSSGGMANLQLIDEARYIAAVKACFVGSCLDPVYSDGFQISLPPNVMGSLSAVYSPVNLDMEFGSSSSGYLEISWDPFRDPQIAYYEWALGTGESGSELLVYWTRAEWFETSVSVNVNVTISLHTANIITVKGYNTAGLYSSISMELRWRLDDGEVVPQSSVPLSPLVVVDIEESEVERLATSDWRQRQFREWDPVDVQYTRSPDSLSGAWPNLRYMRYDYSISTTPTYQSCDSPESIACGETIANSVTVKGLSLMHGQRYYFCVRGSRGEAIHVTPATPPVFTRCSNGITVDLTPPTGGCVHIITPSLLDAQVDVIGGSGSGSAGELRPLLERNRECVYLNESTFQSSTSELFIGWEPFTDVEQYSSAVHISGVAYYEYAIGSAPLATDVVEFVSVGVTTDTVARGLSLQSGHTYYVTVRGIDFTGQSNYSVSHPITIDTSAPPIGQIWISNTTNYSYGLELEWDPVEDLQSNIIRLEWSLGSRPGSSDISGWNSVNLSEAITGILITGMEFYDGQLTFASLKVMNAAGLSSVSSSLGYILESSPPQGGTVYDGPQPEGGNFDLDYTSDSTSLSSHWGGTFSDPHSGIAEYFWTIGSCPGCSDLQGWTSVGIATAATRSGLTLSNGHTYFVTVQACNPFHQCTEASSNGITVDITPPIVGRIVSDYRGNDVQFQSSRSFISAHWEGFHDSESSLLHFIYSVSFNDSYLLPPTVLPPSHTSLTTPSPIELPSSGAVVLSLTAVNRVGIAAQPLTTTVFSDITPPMSTGPVVIDTQWAGSVAMETQYSGSLIHISWNFSDNQTTIDKHFWRLVSDSYIRNPIPKASSGTQPDTTATGIELSDGESYYALVTACNAASLCVQQRSSRVLFDSSPPIDGYFAVNSSEAIALNRTVPGGLTWRNRRGRGYAEINIAFLGFSDPHSRISRYWASVGSGYSLTDLSTPMILEASPADDGNSTYIAKLQLSRLLDLNETVYISLWAENGAGLRSHVIQGSFIVEEVPSRNNNGTLAILRSYNCPIESCIGHCTCAARGDLCTIDPALISTCQEQDLSMLSTDMQLLVNIVAPQQIYGTPGDPLFSASTDKLIGRWEFVNPLSTAIQRVEWSFSEEGFPPGMGLMDGVNNIIWREADQSNTVIFSISPSYPLRHGISYVFHVRAWYSNISYAVFTSDSVTIDTVYPSVVRGARAREVEISGSSEVDLDYTSSDNQIEVSWQNVFIPSLSGSYAFYEIAIGDTPGADNVYPFTLISNPSLNRTLISDLPLTHGRQYYATVQAVSPLGVREASISDGFVVDLSPPSAGVVLDGMGMEYQDSVAQFSSETYSARWFGFNDLESGIHHYELAVSNSREAPPQGDYVNVGIALRETLTTLTLTHAQTYYAHVIAENNAGLRSYDVVSSSVTIDNDDLNRRPLARPRQPGATLDDSNLILNPSFESVTGTRCDDTDLSLDLATQNWTLQTIYSELVTTSSSAVPYKGCTALLFIGTISQIVTTSPGVEYELSFAMKRNNSLKLSEVLVNFPGHSQIIPLFSQKQSDSPDGWVRYSFIFTTPEDSNTSEISLSTVDNSYAIFVDNFSIVPLNSSTEIAAPPGEIVVTWPEAVHISHSPISQSWTQLYASWDIFDPESGVREYLWAMGTVPGGEQLQSYISTGAERQGVSEWLSLRHSEVVYVSVVAWNNAGLERVVYSRGYTVDLTPPTISGGGVVDGEGGGVDIDFQSDSTHFAVNFSACLDPESGLKEIRWALGSARGLTDIEPFNIYPGNATSAAVDLLIPLPHGLTIYSTVICVNNAGLFTVAHSDGVTVLTEPPLSSDAFLRISTSNLTHYESLSGFLPSSDVTLYWGGFEESSRAPLIYEVRLLEEGGVATNWTNLGHAFSLTLPDLPFEVNVTHAVEVRAVNLAGIPSDPLARNFTVVPSPPEIATSGDVINATWITDSELQLEWFGAFSSAAPLYFELSLGPQMGSGSILKWVELSTMATSFTVTNSRLRRSTDYFVALTAISYSGLHTNVNQLLAGLPLEG